MKCLVFTLFTVSLAATAQQPLSLPPCGHGVYPCIDPGGSGIQTAPIPDCGPGYEGYPQCIQHQNQQPATKASKQNTSDELAIYRDQQEWLFAQRWVDVHGCGGSKGFKGLRWSERFNLGTHSSLRQKVAYICRWR